MEEQSAYFEFQSYIQNSTLDISNAKLIEAMRFTAIQGFGWSIGLVMDNDEYKPRAKDRAVEAIIKTDQSLDNWSLTAKGDLYILKTLFEDRRDRSAIFIDVRLVRLVEAFARTAALYKYLGVSLDKIVKIKFKYGGLLNRTLKIANQNRFLNPFEQRKSVTDTFSREYEGTLKDLLSVDKLEETIVPYIKDLAQLFDSFELDDNVARGMLKEHPLYRGIVQTLAK